jgi:hypothetical protein
VDGQFYLTGAPGKQGWYANCLSTFEFKLHLTRDLIADLDAYAMPVLQDSERRRVLRPVLDAIGRIEDQTGSREARSSTCQSRWTEIAPSRPPASRWWRSPLPSRHAIAWAAALAGSVHT